MAGPEEVSPVAVSPKYSTLELLEHDATAAAPERDHAIVAPENDRQLDAPQVSCPLLCKSELTHIVDGSSTRSRSLL